MLELLVQMLARRAGILSELVEILLGQVERQPPRVEMVPQEVEMLVEMPV